MPLKKKGPSTWQRVLSGMAEGGAAGIMLNALGGGGGEEAPQEIEAPPATNPFPGGEVPGLPPEMQGMSFQELLEFFIRQGGLPGQG